MGTLDTAVKVAAGWPAEQRVAHEALLRHLEGVVAGYEEARTIWREYVESRPHGPLTGSRWTILNWIGPDRAHRLWSVNRRINEHIGRVSELTGADLPWSFPTDEVMIDAADKQLVHHPGESGVHAARVAIEAIDGRVAHTRALIETLRSGRTD